MPHIPGSDSNRPAGTGPGHTRRRPLFAAATLWLALGATIALAVPGPAPSLRAENPVGGRDASAELSELLDDGVGATRPDSAAPEGTSAATPGPTYPGVFAFVDVHVVPMDSRRILERQTVVVRNGIIRQIGAVDSVEVPPNAVVVPGEGRRYLLPGLGDMYARLPDAEEDDQTLEDLLFLYLANGVTTIRQSTGRTGQLALERRLRREQLLGPTLFVASPPFEYRTPFDADTMNAAITAVARTGWDLLRVSENLSLRAWNLLAAEIRDYAIGFGGPVPDSVGLHHALASGVSTVDRLDGLIEAAASEAYQRRIREWYAPGDTTGLVGPDTMPTAPTPTPSVEPDNSRTPPPPLDSLAATLSVRKARAVAGKARASGVWMVPTLSGWEMRLLRERPESLLERPEMRYVPREMRGRWVREKRSLPMVDSLTAARTTEIRMATTKALNDVAGGLILGTDSPSLFNVPGFSIHREMELMREAGITPYEVLLAATRSVARYASVELREAGNFGTVASGNRADLILVEGNPLEDLATLRQRVGVMIKGRWLPRAEIEARLQEIAARHEGPTG